MIQSLPDTPHEALPSPLFRTALDARLIDSVIGPTKDVPQPEEREDVAV
ncbi:hypothetical protein [Thalassovita aquimarina]|uniref:Transposase n=1 Tax=Thalassovita aquimarina TaxID=2785917 RepID=A0ABS5HQ55_9RHOB|nr:hypothetical protein [Thalassovita aquimarina]MBR9650698.1 hypothetical protein [Thalassovita aquimarina]